MQNARPYATLRAIERPLFVQFGAGSVGRSLAGALFSSGGYDVLFVDAVPALVQALHARRAYRVVVKDDLPPETPAGYDVRNVDAIDAGDAAAVADAVRRADVIGTAVGANALSAVLSAMAPGLAQRERPVSIILCENLLGAAAFARQVLEQRLPPGFTFAGRVGLVETSIGKMVPIMPAEARARDPLEVWGEAYNRIIADRDAFVGPAPAIPGLDLKSNFAAYVERKLYIHNLGHAVCACEGFIRGHVFIWQAVADPFVEGVTRVAMASTADALIRRHPAEFTSRNQAEHVADLLRRFGNRALGDTVHRVGRDLPRKLAPGDRFIGSLRLVQSTGGDIGPVCRGIAAALRFAAPDEQGRLFPADTAFRKRLAAEGVRGVLTGLCGLDPAADAGALAQIEAAL